MSDVHPSDAELSRRQRCDARLESDAVPAFDADGESIQYRGPEIPGAALPVPAQEAEAERLLRMIRANCRVVYYPPDGMYPLEHAPHARKDMWDAIVYALRDQSGDALDANVGT